MNAVVITLLCLTHFINAKIIEEYDKVRTNILQHEAAESLGGDLQLNEDEKKLNKILMKLKNAELSESFHNSGKFNFSRHYFTYKEYINQSKVYSIIKRMPKGAALHVHGTFMLDEDYLLSLTYEDHLYVCYTKDRLTFRFSLTTPHQPCLVDWILLSELRSASDNVTALDLDIKKRFTLYSKDEKDIDMDLDKVWEKFHKIHGVTKSLITYRPIREKFIYESLRKLYEDNVMYAEIRSGLHNLYELNQTVHDPLYLIKLHRDITRTFKEDYPDFVGIKFIITKHRAADDKAIRESINTARKIKTEYPDMLAGFDLVGQEDKGKPLRELLPLLLEAKKDLNLYLHGGETKWLGTKSDENLLDAVLLRSKRLGHAYSLPKHPIIISMVKQQDIALEVNVISNEVLALVRDVRNHPLAIFLSLGLPVVLSSDDPGVWGADPLSHDFYVAFVGIASKQADLRLLRNLALNSIKYSALDVKRKAKFFEVFEKRWTHFVQETLANEN